MNTTDGSTGLNEGGTIIISEKNIQSKQSREGGYSPSNVMSMIVLAPLVGFMIVGYMQYSDKTVGIRTAIYTQLICCVFVAFSYSLVRPFAQRGSGGIESVYVLSLAIIGYIFLIIRMWMGGDVKETE